MTAGMNGGMIENAGGPEASMREIASTIFFAKDTFHQKADKLNPEYTFGTSSRTTVVASSGDRFQTLEVVERRETWYRYAILVGREERWNHPAVAVLIIMELL
jgi:hypothetical protein